MTQPRVVVVGAGIAGLAAALRLERAGTLVTVVPARGPGGDGSPGHEAEPDVEPEAALVPARHPALAELDDAAHPAERLEVRPLDRACVLGAHGRRGLALRGGGLLGVGRGWPIRDAWRRHRLESLARWFAPILDAERPERAARLDDRSLADFARIYLGRRPARGALDALAETGFALQSEQASRRLLFRWIDDGARLALATLTGGGELRARVAKRLRDVREGAPTLSVRRDGRGVLLDDGSSLDADAVIVSCAADAVPQLLEDLSPAEEEALSQLAYTTRVTLRLRAGGDLLEGAAVGWVPRPFGGLLAGLLRAGADTWLLAARPSIERAWAGPKGQAAADALLRDAQRLLPGLRSSGEGGEAAGGVRDLRLQRRRVPRFDVGHFRRLERLRSEEARRFAERPIAFAGDWAVAPDPEGEACSGQRAADRVLDALAPGARSPQI
jgi:glycine/D-amino acid oxidase-like deaminating enzyme